MPKVVATANLTVCVQAICTEWSKASRGGEEAVRRNRVPEALKLPEFTVSALPVSYVLHQARFTAENDFREPVRNELKVEAYAPVEIRSISFAVGESSLAVCYQWERSQGAPPRQPQKAKVLSLDIGQWGRVCYNGRHAPGWEGDWWYDKWVYNVGLFHSSTRSAFLTSQPAHVSSHMSHLW